MSYIDPQVRRAAKDLNYESHTCKHYQETGQIGLGAQPCICTEGKLYYPWWTETDSRERPVGCGNTEEQMLALWAR